ncbi:MAG: sn-glycerol-1-phosphate dehydrogenase [Clostridia bacterium]|nr:sn-glycerol-1-phosphate dehydrogenase [Clostridia bacterium]
MSNVKDLCKGILGCNCGKDHLCPIDYIEIGHNILPKIDEMCANYKKIHLVADSNTFRVCGETVMNILGKKVRSYVVFDTPDFVLIPNEKAIEKIENSMVDDTDIIVGVGSGVINDLCKYVSHKNGLPYYIVATAPSMDGYASVGSALILNGMKVTLGANPPKGIIADTAVLANAPFPMIQAGWGDIIGKYSCLNDWKLSALINGEYFCQRVYDLTMDTTDRVRELAARVKDSEETAVGELMEALVTVGIAMSYVGNSRPASGSEHHLSHFFEITGILDGKEYFPHGIDVIYSAVATAALREKIANGEPHEFIFDRTEWEKNINDIYTSSADEVIALQDKMGWYTDADRDSVFDNLAEIKKVLKEAPTEQEMLSLLREIGLDYKEFVELYGAEKIDNSLLFAKDLKDRYSVLWLNYKYFK